MRERLFIDTGGEKNQGLNFILPHPILSLLQRQEYVWSNESVAEQPEMYRLVVTDFPGNDTDQVLDYTQKWLALEAKENENSGEDIGGGGGGGGGGDGDGAGGGGGGGGDGGGGGGGDDGGRNGGGVGTALLFSVFAPVYAICIAWGVWLN